VVVKEKKEIASPAMLPEVDSSTLLPKYEELDEAFSKPLGPILPHMPESDPYALPFILPSFEDQDPPVMHPPHEESKAARKTSSSLLPPSKGVEKASLKESRDSHVSLLPPEDDIPAMASRGFATSARHMRRPNLYPGKRQFSTVRTTSTRVASGSPRGRIFALCSSCSSFHEW